jgi:hypothetical protein
MVWFDRVGLAYHAAIEKVKILTGFPGHMRLIYQVLSAKPLPCKTLLA